MFLSLMIREMNSSTASVACRIDARGRFVEHQDVRPRCQSAGDEHALLLATGEFSKPLMGKLLSTNHSQAFPSEGALAWRDKTARADASISAHQSNVEPCQQINRIELVGLRNIAEPGRCAYRRGKVDPAGEWLQQPKQRLEQSRFARTVGTENGGETGPGNRYRNPRQDRLAIIADTQVVQGDKSFIHIKMCLLSRSASRSSGRTYSSRVYFFACTAETIV